MFHCLVTSGILWTEKNIVLVITIAKKSQECWLLAHCLWWQFIPFPYGSGGEMGRTALGPVPRTVICACFRECQLCHFRKDLI